MTYVVTDNCIRCKYMDCVAVCPVNCFYEGEHMLVIHPDECIDCGVCEPECPADAIRADTVDGMAPWIELNARMAPLLPNIDTPGEPPADRESWLGMPDKLTKVYGGPQPERI